MHVMTKEWFTLRVMDNQTALYRTARSIMRNPQDAEDAVQEAILAAYAGLPGLRDPERFKPWILHILTNRCYEMCRERRIEADIDALGEVIAAPSEDHAGAITLRQAVDSLPYELRSTVTLFYYEDMTVRQISEILGLSEAGVKTRLYRGRERLRALLGEERDQ